LAKEWHNRPLENLYPIVFFDAIHYKVTSEGKVTNKAAYTCLSLNIDGRKDLLGLWVSEAEGANFWLTVLTELKNRGVQDILIACVDGLKGFPEAINTVFPKTEIQLCIIHLIRNTLRYIASKDQKAFMKDLKTVYSAPTEEAALIALDRLEESWGKKYSLAIKTWRNNWTHASTFFKYPDEIRKMIIPPTLLRQCIDNLEKSQNQKVFFPMMMPLKKCCSWLTEIYPKSGRCQYKTGLWFFLTYLLLLMADLKMFFSIKIRLHKIFCRLMETFLQTKHLDKDKMLGPDLAA
jgi:putative transposase